MILDRQILTLTRMEYRLLALLVEHAGEVVPRPILLKLKGTVDVHFWAAAQKIRHILRLAHRNRIGVGYRFRPSLPRS